MFAQKLEKQFLLSKQSTNPRFQFETKQIYAIYFVIFSSIYNYEYSSFPAHILLKYG